MYRLWRYLVAVNYSSPFITLPSVGGGAGQTSFTKAVYDLFFANKRQEVLIMGGYDNHYQATNEVTKMIVELNGAIRFEASTPMLQARNSLGVVYHQGEVFSISTGSGFSLSSGSVERLDTLTQTQTELEERLPNDLFFTTAAVMLDNTLLVVSGEQFVDDQGFENSDMVYGLDEHASEAGQGTWRAQTASLNTALCGAAAITCEGKPFVCGGSVDSAAFSSIVEFFDRATGAWQVEGDMTKARSSFYVCIFEEELYAVGGDAMGENTTIEKRNKDTKQWEHVANCGQDRSGCAAVLVGSKVFLLGGHGSKSTYDFMDLHTKMWASMDVGGVYFDEDMRQLPRQVESSAAVLITPPAAFAKKWTDVNVVKLEDRNTTRYNERFEAVTGKAIQWDA